MKNVYEERKTNNSIKREIGALVALIFLVFLWYKSRKVTPYMYTAPRGPAVYNHELTVKLLKKDPENFRFDWSNWTSTWNYGDYSRVIKNPKRYPRLSQYPNFEDLQLPNPDPDFNEEEWKVILTKWLKERMDAPSQIVQLHKNGKPEVFPVQHRDPKRNNEFYNPELSNSIECPGDISYSKNYLKYVSRDEFRWDIEHEKKIASAKEKKYLEKYNACGDNCPKFFFEHSNTLSDGQNGQHYDWKFYKDDANAYERQITLQSLARAWASFANQFQIDYWFSHGAALAWAWNGMAFPWDTDLDVEIPIQSFKKLAFNFSNSLIVPDPKTSKRAYFLEINPYFLDNRKGNGLNIIDGRFIDIETGLFIDLASIQFFDKNSVRCKNSHYYHFKELATRRYTKFEGVPCYEPVGIFDILEREFYGKGLSEMKYRNWVFNGKLRIWTYKGKCNDIDFDRNCFKYEEGECNTKLGTCNKRDLIEYALTSKYTDIHVKSIADWSSYKNDKPYSKDVFKDISPNHYWHKLVVG